MSGVRESGPETPGTEQRKRKGSPGESLDPRSQWIAEKRRREQEQRYVEELAELVSANLAEFVGNVKPDTCAVLRETVLQIRQLKRQEQEQCASSRGEVQQPDISSSGQSVIEKDSLGPLLLKALDAFFFVVNAEGYLAFVSENVRCYLGFGQEELLNSYVYNLLHIGDHEEFSRHLPKPPANSTPWHSDGTRHSSHTFHCRMLVHRSSNEAATPAAEDQYETMQCFAVVQPPAADESDGDLQPCLICVARRAQRHEMPTVETFSTRQDKTGKIIAIDTSSLQASMRPGWQILVRKCIHAFFQNVENGLPLSHRHHRDVLMKGFAQSAPYRFALPDGSMAVGQSKSRMQALPNQTHIVSSIHTVFRYCKHSGEGLVRPSPVIPDQISATNDPNGGTPSASLNCPQTPMGIVSGRSDVSMGRLPPGAPPPGRYVGMPGAMALGSPSRNSPCGAVGSGPMPCQGSYMRTPRTPPVAKPVGSPGMPFSPQRPSGPYLTNAGFACPGASPGEGITPGSGTPPGQTPSPSPRLVSPSPSVTSPCQVVTPSVGQRIPYVPRSYSTGHYGKQEDWSAEGKEQIATATPGSTQQNIECSQADGTTQECEEPAKSPTKLLQLLTVGPEVGGRLSLDSVRSSEPPGSGPATSNSGSNTDGSAGGSGITGGGAAGCAGGGGVSPSLHSTSLTERHKILHKLLQDGSSSPDINKLTASQQPLSVGSGQGSIKAEELSTVKQEPVSPLQRRQDRDHALLRSLLDKEEEQRTRPVEHLPDSDVKPKLEKSESGRDVSYGPGVCGSIKIEKPDMQVKVESGEQHTPDRFENLNEGLGRESTAENSKALLQDLLQTPSNMPSLQASSNFRTASSHVVAAMGRANSQLMSRPPFPNGPGQSRPLLSYSTSLSHVQGGPTHSATAPTHHGMVPGPGHARRSSMPGSDVWVAPGSMGMCQPQAGTAPGISGYPAMQNMLGSPPVSMPMRQVSQSNAMIDAGSGEVILGMDEMQYSAQHQGGWNEGVVSVEGTGLTEHRRIGFLATHEGMVCPPGPGETVADDSALMEQLHSLLSNADEQELAEIDRALGIDKLVQGGVLDCPIYQSSVEMGPMGLDPKHMMSYQGHPVYAGHITTPGYPAYGDVAPGAPPTYSPGWGVRGTTQYVPRQLHPLQARQAAALRGMRPVMGTGAPGGTFPNSAQLRFQLQQRLQGQQMSHGRLTMMGQCYGGPAEGSTLRGSMPQAMAGRVRAVCHPTSHEQVPLNAQMLAQRHREMVNQQLRQQQLMHQQQQQQQQHQQQQQQQRVGAMAQAPGSGFPGVVPQSPGQLGRPPGQQPAYPTGYPTVYNSPPPPQPSSPYPVASGNSLPPQAMTQTVGGSMHVRAGVMGTDIGQFAPPMGQPGVFQFNSGMSQSPEGSYGTPAGSVSPLLSPRLQQQALQMDSEVKAWEGGGIRSASALYHQQYAQPGTPGIFGNMELPDSMTTTNGEPGAAMAQMTPDLPPDIGPGQGFC